MHNALMAISFDWFSLRNQKQLNSSKKNIDWTIKKSINVRNRICFSNVIWTVRTCVYRTAAALWDRRWPPNCAIPPNSCYNFLLSILYVFVPLKFLFDYSDDLFSMATFHVVMEQEQSFKNNKNDKYNRKTLFVFPKTYLTSIDLIGNFLLIICVLLFVLSSAMHRRWAKKRRLVHKKSVACCMCICRLSRAIVNIFAISLEDDVACFLFRYLAKFVN